MVAMATMDNRLTAAMEAQMVALTTMDNWLTAAMEAQMVAMAAMDNWLTEQIATMDNWLTDRMDQLNEQVATVDNRVVNQTAAMDAQMAATAAQMNNWNDQFICTDTNIVNIDLKLNNAAVIFPNDCIHQLQGCGNVLPPDLPETSGDLEAILVIDNPHCMRTKRLCLAYGVAFCPENTVVKCLKGHLGISPIKSNRL
jgi:hypothetical protein